MPRSSLKSEASRKRIVKAAEAEFLKHGAGGIGVDGLAKAAGLTSGAFYFHFKNKLAAFIESFAGNLDDLKAAIDQFQKDSGRAWLTDFAAFYLGYKRTCAMEHACAAPVLSSEVERAGPVARAAYEGKMRAVFESLADGLVPAASATARQQALALMAMLAGGAMIARAVLDPALSEEIAASVQTAAGRFRTRARSTTKKKN